jgi:ankyrin repeat protein
MEIIVQEKEDTPLISASRSGNLECAALLLQAGANIMAVNKVGKIGHILFFYTSKPIR